MPKCDFNELHSNSHIFRTAFHKNTSSGLLLMSQTRHEGTKARKARKACGKAYYKA